MPSLVSFDVIPMVVADAFFVCLMCIITVVVVVSAGPVFFLCMCVLCEF